MYTPSTNVPTDGSAVGESRRVLVMPRMLSSTSSGVSAVSENARHAVGQVGDGEDLVFGQSLAGVCGDRDGRGLQGRLAALRRDDHFLEGLLRLRGHGGGGGENSGHRVGDG